MKRTALALLVFLTGVIPMVSQTWVRLGFAGGSIKNQIYDGGIQKLYALSNNALFYSSTDWGITWKKFPTMATSNGPFNNQLFVENGYLFYGNDEGGRYNTYRTSDDGMSWLKLNIPGSNEWARSIKWVSPSKELFTRTMRSTDHGVSWQKILPIGGKDTAFDQIVFTSDPNRMYGVSTYVPRFMRTTDKGVTWDSIMNGVPSRRETYPFITASRFNPLIVFHLGFYDIDGQYLFRTTDGGDNWIACSGGLPTNVDFINGYQLEITDDSTVYVHGVFGSGGKSKLFLSRDRGETWMQIASSLSFDRVHWIGASMYGYDKINQSLWKSVDGGQSWTLVVIFTKNVLTIDFLDSQHLWAKNNSRVVFLSSDGGLTWKEPIDPQLDELGASFIVSLSGAPPVLFSGSFRSTDNGSSWSRWNLDRRYRLERILATNDSRTQTAFMIVTDSVDGITEVLRTDDGGITYSLTNIPCFGSMYVDLSHPDLMYGLSSYRRGLWDCCAWELFTTNDGGMTWTSQKLLRSDGETETFTQPRGSDPTTVRDITELKVMGMNPKPPNELYLHYFWKQEEPPFWYEGLMYTVDTARTWKYLDWMDRKSSIGEFIFSPSTGDTIIVTASEKISVSTDRGKQWRWMNAESGINSVAPEWTTSVLYAASRTGGVLKSTDFGDTWTHMNKGFLIARVNRIHRTSDGILFAATDEGVYRWQTTVRVQENVSNTPRSPILLQNYPNPFSISTTIPLRNGPVTTEIEHDDDLSLKVFDLLGREILDLTEQARNHSEVPISATQLPTTGIYIYRLLSSSQSQVKMMIYH